MPGKYCNYRLIKIKSAGPSAQKINSAESSAQETHSPLLRRRKQVQP
jgi:hypothetical protein